MILNRHSNGWSIKRICREFGYSRKAVRKVLRDWNGAAPRYKLTKPRPKPVVTDEVRAFVKEVLVADKAEPRKQRHSADKIHKRLMSEKKVAIGRSTTRMLVREVRQELRDHPPATTPLYFAPGEEAQFDWGEVYLNIAGIQVKGNLFVAVLCHSRRTFLRVFPHQNQESFLEAHLLAFEDWGGCPERWAYDNLRAAVKRVLIGGEREESDLFKRFRIHHRAEARYCTPGVEGAHEKGRVEKGVDIARASSFVPLPSFATWEEANAYLQEQGDALTASRHPDHPDQTIAAVFNVERGSLKALPRHRFPACKFDSYMVDGQARIRYDGSWYSLPCEYGRRRVEVRAYHDRLEFYDAEKRIQSCPRSYRAGSENYNYQRYIRLLRRAPGACLNGKPYLTMPKVLRQYRTQLLEQFSRREAGRHLARVLQAIPEAGEGWVCQAVERWMPRP
ncbi:MAG: IS21 family transposase [Candidatus Xenobia bacterium]